jgi:hypothetical protein
MPTILYASDICKLFNVPAGTLGYWRYLRDHGDTSCPRFYRRGARIIYHLEEFTEDHQNMITTIHQDRRSVQGPGRRQGVMGSLYLILLIC